MDPQQHGGPGVTWQAPPEEAGPAPGIRFARLVAYLLDSIVLGIVILVLSFVFVAFAVGTAASDSMGAMVGGVFLFIVLIVVVAFAYFPFFWARGGQTPGMMPFRIRIVRDVDGGPITGGQALMRFVGYWINSIVFYVGFAWILVDRRRRGWHDLIAGTVVIEDPR